MSVIHLDEKSFKALTETATGMVVVDFWAEWCTPCKMLGPVLEELSARHPDITVGKVNVDDAGSQRLAAALMIDSIPALFIFKDGKPVKKLIGYMPLEKLEKELGL